jgi:peroxiredoxin
VIKSIESKMEPQVKETLERGGTTNGGILDSMVVTERFSNMKLDTAIEPAAFIPSLAAGTQLKDSRIERTSVEKLKGWAAPSFDLAVYSGGQRTVGPVKGKVVLLDFWSTWRETCKTSVPMVQSIKQWAGDDVEVFSIAPEATEKVKIWKQAMQMPDFVSVVDPTMKACKAYGLVETVAKRETVAVPSVVVIGTDGRIVDIITEYQSTEPIIRAMLRGGFPVEKLIRTQASGSSGRKESL